MWPVLLALSTALGADDIGPADDPILSALSAEVSTAFEAWSAEEDPPYYLSYRAVDSRWWQVRSRYGDLATSNDDRAVTLDVSARVGSPARDSTHRIRDGDRMSRNFHRGTSLPLTEPSAAIQTAIWEATNKEVRDAQEAWHKLRTIQKVKVEEQYDAPDFAPADPTVDLGERGALELDRSRWEGLLSEASAILDRHPDIHGSSANLSANAETHYFVDSDGTRIRQPRVWLRVALSTQTRTEDGMDLRLYRWKDAHDPADLPPREDLLAWAEALAAHTVALRDAPLGDAYDGPILLKGAAAGVFVHEVIGHRVEGHRQMDESEGQTFRDKVGKRILPPEISIFDDPTLRTWSGQHLNGHYAYDQEGQPAQRAWIVRDGIFEGFLMSRAPLDIEGFDRSNGHGRAQVRRAPVARMANTIVSTSRPVPYAELREQLLDEVRAQGREYGIVVEELAGGFTMTGRVFPNAFNVRATYGWRIYGDGRPDELVRGIDLVGTPLVALTNVVAAGDDVGVFNGFCGAESGSVPNAAVSPSLLIRQLEVQKKEIGTERPPLLPKPEGPGGGT